MKYFHIILILCFSLIAGCKEFSQPILNQAYFNSTSEIVFPKPKFNKIGGGSGGGTISGSFEHFIIFESKSGLEDVTIDLSSFVKIINEKENFQSRGKGGNSNESWHLTFINNSRTIFINAIKLQHNRVGLYYYEVQK